MQAVVRVLNAADYPPGADYRRHGLGDWELVWVLRGSAHWERSGRHETLAPGDILLIAPGGPERFQWDERVSTRHGFAHFLPQPAEAHRGYDGQHWAAAGGGVVGALCGYLGELIAGGEPARARAAEVIGLMAGILVAGPPPGSAGQTGLPPIIDDLARSVGRLWATEGVRPVGLDELAELAGCSRRHLCRLFATHLGEGPVAVVDQLRLNRVAVLLAHSDLSVSAAAAACGYANPFHLSRSFRAGYGLAPRQYRQRAKEGLPLPDPLSERGLHPLAYVLAEAEHP